MSVSVRESNWRRRPQVYHEPVSGVVAEDTRHGQSLGAWLHGPHAEEDAYRVLQGTLCFGCWTPLPDRPLPETADLFANEFAESIPYLTRDQIKRRAREKRCPVCAQECSPEMAAACWMGTEEGPVDEPAASPVEIAPASLARDLHHLKGT